LLQVLDEINVKGKIFERVDEAHDPDDILFKSRV